MSQVPVTEEDKHLMAEIVHDNHSGYSKKDWNIILPQKDCPYHGKGEICRTVRNPHMHCTIDNCPIREKTAHEKLVEQFKKPSTHGKWLPNFKKN